MRVRESQTELWPARPPEELFAFFADAALLEMRREELGAEVRRGVLNAPLRKAAIPQSWRGCPGRWS